MRSLHLHVVHALQAQLENKLSEAKGPTFKEKQAEILDALQKAGWATSPNLKIPHATHPDKDYRVWFKPQALWVSMSKAYTDFANARSLNINDLRKVSVEKLLVYLNKKPYSDFMDRMDRGESEDTIAKGASFRVVSRSGQWPQEMAKGAVLVANEAGNIGQPMTWSFKGWAMGNMELIPQVVKGKMRLTSTRMPRYVVVEPA